ncbi:hypothetical protein ACO0LF_19505, partial [Undibacterium sp. Di27W]
MATQNFIASIRKWAQEHAFLRYSFTFIVGWSVIVFILIMAVWRTHYFTIEQDKKLVRSNALKDVASLSRAYARYLTRTIEQIDQVSMHVKYDWEHSRHSLKLEEQRSQGLFIAPQFELVAIIDAKGKPVTSTIPIEKWQDTTLRGQFFYHQNNNSSAMQIGLPAVINSSGKLVIQFTRRLEDADEAFDGMVVISVEPSYFSSFYDSQSLGKSGLIAILASDGTVGASRLGDVIPFGGGSVFARDIQFNTAVGTGHFSGPSTFIDQQSRILGWQSLEAFFLTAVVGLDEQELFGNYEAIWAQAKKTAATTTIALLLFGSIAIFSSTRLAWKKYQAKQVRDTYRLATEATDEGFYMMNALRDVHGKIIDFQV